MSLAISITSATVFALSSPNDWDAALKDFT
jgi:hypothetical protein